MIRKLLQPFDIGYYTGLVVGVTTVAIIARFGFGWEFVGVAILSIAWNVFMRHVNEKTNRKMYTIDQLIIGLAQVKKRQRELEA